MVQCCIFSMAPWVKASNDGKAGNELADLGWPFTKACPVHGPNNSMPMQPVVLA